MKKKRFIMLFLQLALVVGFSVSFYTHVQKEVKPTKVYTYSQDLNIKDEVKLTVKEIPAKAVQEGMIVVGEKDEKELKSKFLNTKVSKDQFVYESQLAEEGQIDPFQTMDLAKYRKISLPISYVEGFGGEVKRGDKVDLIFTGAGKKTDDSVNTEENFQYSKAFLQDVLVYNVTTSDGYRFDNHSNKAMGEVHDSNGEVQMSASSEELAVVVLAVTLDQAEEIQARQSIGKISFASRFEDNQSYETLGYVIGNYEKVFSAPANAETGRTTIISGQ